MAAGPDTDLDRELVPGAELNIASAPSGLAKGFQMISKPYHLPCQTPVCTFIGLLGLIVLHSIHHSISTIVIYLLHLFVRFTKNEHCKERS